MADVLAIIQQVIDQISAWLKGLFGSTDLKVLFYLALVLVVVIAALFTLWRLYAFISGLIAGTRKSSADAQKDKMKEAATGKVIQSGGESVLNAMNAARYLTTWREWRYQTPWYLVLGDEQSGKTSLLEAISSGRRQRLLLKEKRLAFRNTGWHFFNKGVVVDIAGKCATTAREKESDAITWNRVLSSLEELRPERPIDGIVLTVSAEDLLIATDSSRIQQLADMLYKRLWQVQKQFGFALPVYVIVTKSDLITGFQSFWQTISTRQRQEIFGWSNPYVLETAFSPEWIETAFDSIADDLQQAQVNVAAQCPEMEDADGFFLFPQALSQLQNPVQELISRLFEPSAFHAAFLFRGLYFTGYLPETDTLAETAPLEVAFTDHLFNNKIFAETNFAQPTQRSVFSRVRLIRRAQISALTVLFIAGVWLAFDTVRLDNQVEAIAGSLTVIQDSADSIVSEKQLFSLLKNVADIEANPKYLTIPVSWFDDTQDNISQYIAETAFEKIIFPTLDAQLSVKAQNIAALMQQNNDNVDQQLNGVLNQLTEYQVNLSRFILLSNPNLEETQDELLEDFIQLLQYLYTTPLPQTLHNQGQHRQALRKVGYEPLIMTQTPLTQQFMTMGLQNLLAQAIEFYKSQVQLPAEIVKAAAVIGSAAQKLQPGQALATVTAMNSWQSRVETDWLNPIGGQNPCLRLEGQLKGLSLQETNSADGTTSAQTGVPDFNAETCTNQVEGVFLGLELAPYGTLFLKDGQGNLQMKDDLQQDLATFQKLAAPGFMRATAGDYQLTGSIPASWDVLKLEQALGYYIEFEPIQTNVKGYLQNQGQLSLPLEIARAQLQSVMDYTVNQAQIQATSQSSAIQPLWPVDTFESAISSQVTNLVNVQDQLMELLRLFNQLGFSDSYGNLQHVSQSFTEDLLTRLSSLAADERLYQANFSPKWQSATYSQALFGLTNAGQVSAYLENQRERSFHLAALYANPLVVFLLNTGSASVDRQSADMQQWIATLVEIDRYQKSDPTSTITVLESYFNAKLISAIPELCVSDSSAGTTPASGIDLYSSAYQSVSAAISSNCTYERQDYIASSYQDLANQFNKQLAGKYPFADAGAAISKDASLFEVRSYFDQYGSKIGPLLTQLNQYSTDKDSSNPAVAFLRQLQNLAEFFSGSLVTDATESIQPVSVNTTFRMYPESSTGADQIIYWRLTNGSEGAIYPGSETDLDWQFGQRISLSLQWANSSVYRPKPSDDNPLPLVDSLTAEFSYWGQWALLRMLRNHITESPQQNAAASPNQAILKFSTPLSLNSTAGQVNSQTSTGDQIGNLQCLVYVGFDLTVLDGKTQQHVSLNVPLNYPSFAPELTTGGR